MPLFDAESLRPILDRALVPQLPDPAQLADVQAFPQVLQAKEISWRLDSARTWQSAAQQGLAALGTRVGWPATQTTLEGPAGAIWSFAGQAFSARDFSLAAGRVATEAVLASGLAESAIGAGTQAASALPVLGLAARLIFSIAHAIRLTREVQAGKEASRRLDPGALLPEVDLAFWRDRVLPQLAGTRDWTDLFSPPCWPGDSDIQTANHLAYFVHGEFPGGWAVRPSMLAASRGETGVGCVPGTSLLHAGANAVKVEVRKTYWRVSDTGAFLPTVGHQGPWVWGALEAGGPASVCVDVRVLEDRWTRYLWSLRSYLRQRVSSDLAAAIVDSSLYQDAFGWSRWHRSGRPEPTEYPGAYGLGRATVLERIRSLRPTQLGALRSGAVYVAADSTALSDPEFRSVWDLGRSATLDLLPRGIDLDSIPDLELRAELQRRGAPPFTSLQADGPDLVIASPRGPRSARYVAAVADGAPSGAGGWAAVAAALGAGALLWLRR